MLVSLTKIKIWHKTIDDLIQSLSSPNWLSNLISVDKINHSKFDYN